MEPLKDSLVGIILLGVASSLIASFIWQKYQERISRIIVTVFCVIFLFMAVFVYEHLPKNSDIGKPKQATTTPVNSPPVVVTPERSFSDINKPNQTTTSPVGSVPVVVETEEEVLSPDVGKSKQTAAAPVNSLHAVVKERQPTDSNGSGRVDQPQARPSQQPEKRHIAPPGKCSLLEFGKTLNSRPMSGDLMYLIGDECEFGKNDMNQDTRGAIHWYEWAAGSNDPEAGKKARESLERLAASSNPSISKEARDSLERLTVPAK